MTTARLRSTRRAWPCSGQGFAHSPQNGSALASLTGVDDRPLIPNRSCEHQRNAGQAPSPSEARQPGPSATVVAGTAQPGGVAVYLNRREARQLAKSLERQLKAIRSSLAFWKHETANCGTQPPFNMAAKLYEAELIQRLYLELFDITKTNTQYEKAYKTAKYQE
ncbi:MAG: hypothetical protein ACQEW7_12455 [Pseudomonadota bacterium]